MIDDVVEFQFEEASVRAREILKGSVGCLGDLEEGEYTRGHAQKIDKNSDKLERKEEFTQGSVLVAQMTDPSMMEEIRKCRAIVTETGGLMSHAAIVSRDLNIPCILNADGAMGKIRNGDTLYIKYRTVNQGSFEDYQGVVLKDEVCS